MVPDASLSHLRILVVEDEGLIALNLELMLQRFGCEVVGLISEVGNIIDAVKKHRPDGVLLDVNLRGCKVFDVLPELISLGVPCALASGYDDPALFPAAFSNLPRITKPFDESALRRVCLDFASIRLTRADPVQVKPFIPTRGRTYPGRPRSVAKPRRANKGA